MRHRWFSLYLLAVSGSGLSILFWSIYRDFPLTSADIAWTPVVIMAVGLIIGETLRVEVGRGAKATVITFSAGFGFTLILVAPLAVALIVQTVGILLDDLLARQRDLRRTLFNCGQFALTIGAAHLAFASASRVPMLTEPSISASQFLGLLAGALVYVSVNFVLVGGVASLASSRPTVATIFRDWDVRLRPCVVEMALAPLCLAMIHYSPYLLPRLAMPNLIILHSTRMAMLREQEALHDVLTGLPNRALLRDTFSGMLRTVEDGDGEMAVLLIDLDHFKDINDTLGHHVGDMLLCEVARRLTSVMREGDLVARLGGDEFAVLAMAGPGEGREASAALAERLVRVLDQPFDADGVRIDVRGSVGVALAPEHGKDMETLMSRADIALYLAKESRGCWAAYDPETDKRSPEHLSLLGQLREGIECGQIEVHYQPKMEVRSGRVVGVEALARWRHPDRGLLSPDQFIPMAEATGLIVPLTLEVLEQSLRTARSWRDHGWDLGIAVNLSVRHLTDAHLPEQVAAVLTRHDVPAELLSLEVTESTVMSDPLQAAAVLRGLRSLGLKISLDDYGVGYCSLAYLCRLEVEELKIDQSLVRNMDASHSDSLVVRSTIALAHDLGLQVVAEGVENVEALSRLAEMKCDIVQGYYFSRPLPPAELEAWLTTQDVAAREQLSPAP